MFAVDEARLITGKPFDVGVGVTLYQPTVAEILEFGEDDYMSVVTAITNEPFDVPYILDQMGIDFTKVTPFEVFCVTMINQPLNKTKLLFGDLDFTKFRIADSDGKLTLIHPDGAVFDALTRERLADAVRRMHCLPKNIITSCENDFTRKLLISQQKKDIERAKRKKEIYGESSQYAALVSSLAYKWGSYDKVLSLKVGQFFDAITRSGYYENSHNLYRGIVGGTIQYSSINKKELDWMRPIQQRIL